MPKPNHIKIVIFRKHFSCSLRSIYGLICFFFGILIYFTFLLSFWQKKKKVFWKLFFSIFLQFLMHFLIPSGANFITNIKYGVWGSKEKIKYNISWPLEMSARCNFPKLVEISKNLKTFVVCLKFQCPKRGQVIPKLINLSSLNVEFYNLDEIIKICVSEKFSLLPISL